MKFKKHKQFRLPGYDYSQNGAYFITIVTKSRFPYFGQIEKKEMQLSPIGQFVEQNFKKIKEKITYLEITEYSIMPDHLHLIIVIDKTVSLTGSTEISIEFTKPDLLFPLANESVSAFVNHLKGTIKKWCNKNNYREFEWQGKFHDHIIRNEKEYRKIVAYIRNNVINASL
jgi:putative transposase